jgi:hypothetical protein
VFEELQVGLARFKLLKGRKMKLAAPLAALAIVSGFAVPSPVLAQDAQGSSTSSATTGQRLAEIVVFGNDPCPRSTDDEVVVCSRVPESYRYRMPESYRPSGTYQQGQAWANKARSIERVGRTGIQSCSPVGPAGYTGCLNEMINEAKEESREARQGSRPPQ